jgi:GNAT superfamily N-acetyltransferase
MARDRLVIETDAMRLVATPVPWDSESFGFRVAQVDDIEVWDLNLAGQQIGALTAWLLDGDFRVASCRLAHDRLKESSLLEALGFRFIEIVFAMELATQSLPTLSNQQASLRWRRAEIQDLPALQEIAAEAFVTGRWNVDWHVGPRLAGRRYADWVARSLSNPSHEVLIPLVRDRIVGLFIVETGEDNTVYWHLTAVAPDSQGHGVGREMWASMVERHRAAGMSTVRTTISAHNLPVLNLYAKQGWKFRENRITLHWNDDRNIK